MAPKKGSKKVSLNQFLSVAPTKGDWADDDFDLPTAPAVKDPASFAGGGLDFAPDRASGDYASWRGAAGYAHDRQQRPDVPLPSAPPYTAFIGGLSFDATEADLADFFDGLPITSIRVVTESFTGRSRGFGYVEFATLEALQDGLSRTGGVLAGRPVRISVAEPPSHGAFSSAADDADQWRRTGPVPTSSARPGFGREFNDGPSGFDSMEVAGGVRAGFGSKFDPSAAGVGSRRVGFGAEFDPFAADDAATWRTGKPVEARHSARNFPHANFGEEVVIDRSTFGQKVVYSPSAKEDRPRGVGLAHHTGEDVILDRSTFGSKMPPPAEPRHPRRERKGEHLERPPNGRPTPGFTEEGPWRRPGLSSPRAERPHLKLQPRSSALPPVGAEAAHSTGKPSPFGAARPVDSAERERQITARLEERRRAERARRPRKAKASTGASSQAGDKAESEAGDNGSAPPAQHVAA